MKKLRIRFTTPRHAKPFARKTPRHELKVAVSKPVLAESVSTVDISEALLSLHGIAYDLSAMAEEVISPKELKDLSSELHEICDEITSYIQGFDERSPFGDVVLSMHGIAYDLIAMYYRMVSPRELPSLAKELRELSDELEGFFR